MGNRLRKKPLAERLSPGELKRRKARKEARKVARGLGGAPKPEAIYSDFQKALDDCFKWHKELHDLLRKLKMKRKEKPSLGTP